MLKPAVIEPVAELVKVIKENTVQGLVLIDGAHAPGHIDVDISSIAPDFYLGNCHKWLYGYKGTAFLWVAPSQQLQESPEPTVISSSGKQDYIGRYSYTGTRDYTAFASLPASISFREFLGGSDAIIGYCHGLAIEAANYLTKQWNTYLIVRKYFLCLS
jgi:selenocysteine lyase/cysteine desulfurase